jgi:hypothetical protein
VADYYAAGGSYQRVHNVQIPLLVIQAEDDPIAPIRATPKQALLANPNCILAGAHIECQYMLSQYMCLPVHRVAQQAAHCSLKGGATASLFSVSRIECWCARARYSLRS